MDKNGQVVDAKSDEKQPSKLLPPPLEDVRKALVCWDDVFSKANTTYESLSDDWVKEHCDKTEESVRQAMFQMREMGFSITPKIHGLECHLVHQMRTVPGGIAMLIHVFGRANLTTHTQFTVQEEKT
eukprot:scaffold3819_cov98-Skeletonema_dohrnii-CCMP3373.AAC.7